MLKHVYTHVQFLPDVISSDLWRNLETLTRILRATKSGSKFGAKGSLLICQTETRSNLHGWSEAGWRDQLPHILQKLYEELYTAVTDAADETWDWA